MSISFKVTILSAALMLCQSLQTNDAFAAEEWKTFTASELSFTYPGAFDKAKLEKKKAVPLANPDEKPDGVATEHLEISFPKSEAKIYIFKTEDKTVKDFAKAYPTVSDAVKDLKSLLSSKPKEPKNVPVLPWADASTPFHSQAKYLNFKDGTGVRYLAEYQIENEMISNDGLIYSLQGLSKDGKYYLAASFPLRTKSLPEKSTLGKMSKAKQNEFSKNYSTYASAEGAKLNKLPETAFSPSPSTLDRIISSIQLKGF